MSAAVVIRPCSRAQPVTSSNAASSQMLNLSADPIDARNDLGENASVELRETITPETPAASAVLRIAPRFAGLFTLLRKMVRPRARLGSRCSKRENEVAGRRQSSNTPCEFFV